MGKAQTIVKGFDPKGPFSGLVLPVRFRKRQRETRFKQEWRLTLAQYAALMREFVGPRRQRGSIILSAFGGTTGGASGSVVLTNHSFTADQTSPGSVSSGVRFNNNGELWEEDDGFGSDTQQNGEWWSEEPEADIGDGYEVQQSGGSGSWTFEESAINVWITLNLNRNYYVTETTPVSSKTCTRTFGVGLDGVESAIDSASITCTALLDL